MSTSEQEAWQEIVELVKQNCVQTYAGANRYDYDRVAGDFVSSDRIAEQIKLIEQLIGKPVGGQEILEVGASSGLFVALARTRFGVEAYGIEPGGDFYSDACSISQKVLQYYDIEHNCIVNGVGEYLPFPSNKFDIVCSFNVLEHVQSPAEVIHEAFRVLKPGGALIFVIPNYGSWWEGHYGILWPPNLPRWLGRLYVTILGRDPQPLDDLQLVSFKNLQPIVNALGSEAKVITWGREIWVERMQNPIFSEWAGLSTVKRIVQMLHHLKIVSLVIWLGKRFHWETPLILHMTKLAREKEF